MLLNLRSHPQHRLWVSLGHRCSLSADASSAQRQLGSSEATCLHLVGTWSRQLSATWERGSPQSFSLPGLLALQAPHRRYRESGTLKKYVCILGDRVRIVPMFVPLMYKVPAYPCHSSTMAFLPVPMSPPVQFSFHSTLAPLLHY